MLTPHLALVLHSHDDEFITAIDKQHLAFGKNHWFKKLSLKLYEKTHMLLDLKTIHRMNCIHIDDTHFHPSPQSRAKNNMTALYTEVVCATTKNIINEKDLNLKQKVLVSFHRTL